MTTLEEISYSIDAVSLRTMTVNITPTHKFISLLYNDLVIDIIEIADLYHRELSNFSKLAKETVTKLLTKLEKKV
ncbi:hypothetical protein [cyanobacterium endosymbiont of Rhopalodia gibberula]|uniref:hypothetical protein n=1 Tax=cyanobacterium endosymbiont of Rhopalodia gibberula TaxID=1763363 RepID=UPI0011AB6BAF|nr:hypothetical protein [cyanobacterium endosymbiont of Rhopalodia gibberula]